MTLNCMAKILKVECLTIQQYLDMKNAERKRRGEKVKTEIEKIKKSPKYFLEKYATIL